MLIKYSHGIKDVQGLEAYIAEKIPGAEFRVAMTNETESMLQVQDNLKKEIMAVVLQYKDSTPILPSAEPPQDLSTTFGKKTEENQVDESAEAIREAMKSILSAAKKSSLGAVGEAEKTRKQFGESIKTMQDAEMAALKELANLEVRIAKLEESTLKKDFEILKKEFEILRTAEIHFLSAVLKSAQDYKSEIGSRG